MLGTRERNWESTSNHASYYRLLQWLAIAAVADWIFARTLSRSAIFMPKTPAMLTGFQVMLSLGNFAANVTSLLAITAMFWMAWRLALKGQRALPLAVGALLIFNLGALLFAPSAAVTLTYHLIAVAAIFLIVRPVLKRSQGAAHTLAVLLATAAVSASELHQAAAAFSIVVGTGEPIGLGMAAFNLGETLVVAFGLAIGWWMRPNRNERWIWAVAAVPTTVIAAFYIAAPSISSVMAIWSLGLTLFLPWPLYVLSLWALTGAMLTGLKRRHPAGLAIPMLVAGGYAAQLSTQLFLNLIALYLLAGLDEFTEARETATMYISSPRWIRLRLGSKVEPQ
jgi:hypothetical protein